MNTCWNCKAKVRPDLDLDDCPHCGAGLIESDDDDFVDFLSEYDSDDF